MPNNFHKNHITMPEHHGLSAFSREETMNNKYVFWSLALALAIILAPVLVFAETCRDDIAASASDNRFTDNGDGTVTDLATKLIWKQCSEGLSGADCKIGNAMTFTWQEALQHASDADYAGSNLWRLPNKKELISLVEQRCYDPAINTHFFPNTPGGFFWSSSPGWWYSPNGFYPEAAWNVSFYEGYVYVQPMAIAQYVRLVRGNLALNAAVLPYARAVKVNEAATAFGTVINSGPGTATECTISLPDDIPATFSYQTTNAGNVLVGSPNTPVDIPAGGTQSFVFGITPTSPLFSTEIGLVFDCANSNPAPSHAGLNTLILTASATPPPDLVAIGATPSNDGVVRLTSPAGTGFFATAAVNIGSSGTVIASADDGGIGLPVALQLCETDNAGNWISCGNNLSRSVAADQTVYYTVFVTGTGQPISFDPANKRLFLRFSANGQTVGATNVAVTTD